MGLGTAAGACCSSKLAPSGICLLTFLLAVQPILVLENEEAVAEIMQLKNMPLAGTFTRLPLQHMQFCYCLLLPLSDIGCYTTYTCDLQIYTNIGVCTSTVEAPVLVANKPSLAAN